MLLIRGLIRLDVVSGSFAWVVFVLDLDLDACVGIGFGIDFLFDGRS